MSQASQVLRIFFVALLIVAGVITGIVTTWWIGSILLVLALVLYVQTIALRPPPTASQLSFAGSVLARRIDDPAIGFLNLCASAGVAALRTDRHALEPLFAEVRESDDSVPQCAVLFVYCVFDAEGKIVGRTERLRDIIRAAGASIAVVASENLPDHYLKALGPLTDSPANVVMTINRKGDTLSRFFAELFRRMYKNESMLMVWVDMAPQIPDYDHPNAPGTIMVAEAGHLVFRK